MSRKKSLLVIFCVLLLLLGDYLYWTVPLVLKKEMPEEVYDSVKMQLFYYDQFFDQKEIPVEDAALTTVLEAVEQTEVTRRPKSGTMSEPFFRLFLYYPDGYTMLTVVENGKISLNPRIADRQVLYFDGGEELYQTLLTLVP